jgi:hypothetical protein
MKDYSEVAAFADRENFAPYFFADRLSGVTAFAGVGGT